MNTEIITRVLGICLLAALDGVFANGTGHQCLGSSTNRSLKNREAGVATIGLELLEYLNLGGKLDGRGIDIFTEDFDGNTSPWEIQSFAEVDSRRCAFPEEFCKP